MEIKTANELTKKEWNAFVDEHPDTSVYHRYEGREIVEKVFGHETCYFYALNENRITGIFPLIFLKSKLFGRIWVSLAFWPRGGIFYREAECVPALWKKAQDLAHMQSALYMELRSEQNLPIDTLKKEHKSSFLLTLASDVPQLWDQVGPKVRNQVKKAEQSGLKVQTGGQQLLNDYYLVFSRCMRDLGTPVLPISFFRSILEVFSEDVVIFVVYKDQQPISSSLCFIDQRKIEVPWASSIKEYNPFCPNMLLYWSMIRYGVEKKIKYFDFGRGTKGGGTYYFKKQWGGREVQHTWYYWSQEAAKIPQASQDNSSFSLPVKIWKKLPLSFANWLGPRIIKHIPV